MSRSFNKVILIGNVGTEPVLRSTPSGVPITFFRLATSEFYRDKDGKPSERTDWHTIVAWRGLAEITTKIIKKGSRVFVEGSLHSRDITEKNGTRKQVVEVVADNILILDGKRDRAEGELFSSDILKEDSDFSYPDLSMTFDDI
jgi:single-strand DNA-binding protein